MFHHRNPRLYRGLPAKTRLVTTSVRVPVDPQRRETVIKPPGCRLHQGGAMGIFRFQPDPEYHCCKARCMSHFTEEDDERVLQARAPLFDDTLGDEARRSRLQHNWKHHLRFMHHDQSRKVCTRAACKIYVCSKSKLYPPKYRQNGAEVRRTKAESNAARAKKSVCVAAWFYSVMETLDVMPDTGYYQLQHARKHMLYDNYKDDVLRWPDIYQKCEEGYFLLLWRENFPNVKLRKHCRFAKCEFCVANREIMWSATAQDVEKADARDKLKSHLHWAHTRERGFYHTKRDDAIKCPERKISIAMDGTDQFINGFPHFWEVTKRDAKGKRFYFHTQICMVHGVGPRVYLSLEDIAGDPNWTIETLYRTLKAEEERRPNGLPKTLYLQVDNCFRENKNTYVISYLCWLVERRVFDEIFLSFLPTGHTHFDPDQFASRISEAIRYSNVLTCAEYARIISRCYGVHVPVEWVHDVMDVKELFNPGKDDNCPVSTSRVLRTRGIGTKSIQPGRDWFMGATSPLHWRVRRDADRRVCVQSKFTVDDDQWTQLFCPWTPDAPRPDGRHHEDGTSGLLASDVTLAPNNPLSAAREKELRAACENVRSRLPAHVWEEIQGMIEIVTKQRTTEMPELYGSFAADFADESDEEQEDHAQLFARPTSVWQSQSQQNRAREKRKVQGHASNPLKVGHYLAYTTHYAPEYPRDKVQAFWLGKILEIDVEEKQVKLTRWHTGTINNLNLECQSGPQYRVWNGPGHRTEWIPLTRVLEVVELTKGHRVAKKDMRLIDNALKLMATMQNVDGEADIAVGCDLYENPDPAALEQHLVNQSNEHMDDEVDDYGD